MAAPGVGLLRVQQAGGVSVCPPVWPGTWVSFQGVSSEDRSFSDAGFQVLWDLEPSGTISRGVFRKCSAPDSIGRKVQQNAAFSQKEPAECWARGRVCQSRWSAICYSSPAFNVAGGAAVSPRAACCHPAQESRARCCTQSPVKAALPWAHTWHIALGLFPFL